MKTKLTLVIDQEQHEEKRIFPRFPYYFLTFRSEAKTFEVRDIAYGGMQIKYAPEDEGHWKIGDEIKGTLRWHEQKIHLVARVKWKGENSLGIEFVDDKTILSAVHEFLSVGNLAKTLHPLHHPKLALDLPPTLKYWLKGDTPVEIFVWCHNDGALSKFQVIVLDTYAEWCDGSGVRTGKLLWGRALETPLAEEEEYTLLIDNRCDEEKRNKVMSFLNAVSSEYLPTEILTFMKSKVSPSSL